MSVKPRSCDCPNPCNMRKYKVEQSSLSLTSDNLGLLLDDQTKTVKQKYLKALNSKFRADPAKFNGIIGSFENISAYLDQTHEYLTKSLKKKYSPLYLVTEGLNALLEPIKTDIITRLWNHSSKNDLTFFSKFQKMYIFNLLI